MLNLLEYLECSAARIPNKTAFADERRAFTYGQLFDFANRCGSAIARRTDETNRPVAVLTERTAVTVAAFQAVLASGNYYVPVDAAMPRQRMESILKQLRPVLLLYTTEQEDTVRGLADLCPVLELSKAEAELADRDSLCRRRARVLDIDPAYAIFTSGSTGTPKGIVVAHRSVIDLTEWLAGAAAFTENDVLGNQAPFYFDGSVKDVYISLKCGATCHILPKKFFSFPKLLMNALNEKGITALQWATAAFRLTAASGALERYAPRSIKKVLLGGEALRAKDLNIWRRALPEAVFINLYGPTEATVDAAWYQVDREFADNEAIPIGRPCANKDILILDDGLCPVPDGHVGELCIRGTGLALGYFGDWEKTRSAFVQNPMVPDYPDRLYRTGDLGYRGEDGLLYFVSRLDGQVKHAGYRIELGEIETAINALADVGEAVCLHDDSQDKLVCIYQGGMDVQQLAAVLRDKLPRYMQPNIYRQIEHMPYNANGKIDRVRLKEMYVLGAD